MIYNQNAITLLQKGHNTRISKDAIVTNWKSPKLTEKFRIIEWKHYSHLISSSCKISFLNYYKYMCFVTSSPTSRSAPPMYMNLLLIICDLSVSYIMLQWSCRHIMNRTFEVKLMCKCLFLYSLYWNNADLYV